MKSLKRGQPHFSTVVLALGVVIAGARPQAQAPAAGTGPDEAALAQLEAAAAAAPDDLRVGSDYRMAIVGAAGDRSTKLYDRAIALFEKVVDEHPDAANAYLNCGFAYVDKIPAAGAITRVILANKALGAFTKSLELRPSWIGYYTRGNSYLFWPRIFGRTKYGIADLEKALAIQRAGPRHLYYVRTYIALGDGYWKVDDIDKAIATWKEGLAEFPGDAALGVRLQSDGQALKTLIEDSYDSGKRVNTSLQDLWAN